MSYKKEPSHIHGSLDKTAVVLVNLGTPDAPTSSAVRRYLREFLSDTRVVEIPKLIWWCILNFIILPIRSSKSAKKYEMIWTKEGSPLKVHTQKQAMLLRGFMGERGHTALQVEYAMRYGTPSLPEVLAKLKTENCERILILPAYPQYSATTTASIFDAVFSHYAQVRNVPELRFVKHYHNNEGYINALRDAVLAYWESHGRGDKLVFSFHGLPQRNFDQGDPYHCECYTTARLLADQLGLGKDQYMVCFQSRFGKAKWLQPYTVPSLQQLAKQGLQRVDVICPGFIGDCLETLEEIAIEAKEVFLSAGGKEFHYISCLNERPKWISALAEIAEQHLIGWPTMLGTAQRDELKKAAGVSRVEALRIGAKD
jgi:ferrochelatase